MIRRWWEALAAAVLALCGAVVAESRASTSGVAASRDAGEAVPVGVRPLEAHRDEGLKLRLKVPKGWQVGSDAAVPLAVVSPAHPSLSIKVARLTPNRPVTPAVVVEASLAQYRRIWTVESREAVTVDGFPAEQVVLVQSMGGAEARIRKLFVGRGEREVLIVSLSAPSADFDEWRATFDAVQSSLVLR